MNRGFYRYIYVTLATLIISFYMTYNLITRYSVLLLSNVWSIPRIFDIGWVLDHYIDWGYYGGSLLYYLLYGFIGILPSRLILGIGIIAILLFLVDIERYKFLIPLITLSLFIEDPLTPILALLLYLCRDRINRVAVNLVGVLMAMHEPILALPHLYWEVRDRNILFTTPYSILIFSSTYMYRYRYLNSYRMLMDPWIILLLAGSYAIYLYDRYPKKRVLYSLSSLLVTMGAGYILAAQKDKKIYRYREKRGRATFIVFLILVASVAAPMIYSYSAGYASLEVNPGVSSFISRYIPRGSTVILATSNPNIMRVLIQNDIHIISYDDARSWNWSNREEISRRIRELVMKTYSENIKYIVLEKGRVTSDWFPRYQFNEYKYGYNLPRHTYLIIMENKWVPVRSPYLTPVNVYNVSPNEDILLNYYTGYWSNTTLNISVTRGEGIKISSTEPFSIYIKFRLPRDWMNNNYVIFRVEATKGDIRHLEIYGDREGVITTLWKNTYIDKNITYILQDIGLHGYNGIQLRIDGAGNITLSELLIHPRNENMYNVELSRGVLTVENNVDAYITLKTRFIGDIVGDILEVPPQDTLEIRRYTVDIYVIYLIIALAILTSIASTAYYRQPLEERGIWRRFNEYKGLKPAMLLLASIPLIMYIGYAPQLLEITWIGGGVFIYAYIMTVSVYTLFKPAEKTRAYKGLLNLLMISTPVLIASTTVLKNFYLNNMEKAGTWYIESYYSTIDTLAYALLYTFIGFIISRYSDRRNRLIEGIVPFIPALYLWTMTILYLVDLTKTVPMELFIWIMYLNAYGAKLLSPLYGVDTHILPEPSPYGVVIDAYSNIGEATVILGWPCTGVTGVFLYTALMSIEYIVLTRRLGASTRYILSTYAIGLTITLALNILRVTTIIYLAVDYGIKASELFHNIGYELIFLVWILAYMYLVDRIWRIRINH